MTKIKPPIQPAQSVNKKILGTQYAPVLGTFLLYLWTPIVRDWERGKGTSNEMKSRLSSSSMPLVIRDGDSDPDDLALHNQLGNYSKVNRMKNFLMNIWRDEAGAETAEWIVIVALILAVALVVYTGILQNALTAVVTGITTTLTANGLI